METEDEEKDSAGANLFNTRRDPAQSRSDLAVQVLNVCYRIAGRVMKKRMMQTLGFSLYFDPCKHLSDRKSVSENMPLKHAGECGAAIGAQDPAHGAARLGLVLPGLPGVHCRGSLPARLCRLLQRDLQREFQAVVHSVHSSKQLLA